MERRNWTEDETILTYYYYCQIPFGKIHKTNPDIIRIAEMIGRTPSSVVFKMGNLGHFDPELQKRNVNGLSNGSRQDEEIVKRFLNDWEALTSRAKAIEDGLTGKTGLQMSDFENDDLLEGIEREQLIKQRINQDFFRQAVLTAYRGRCCMTGISHPQLLVASHIKPWKDSDPKTERTNPGNGLCLNSLHDKAFDRGLITVLPDYSIRVSSVILMSDDPGSKWLSTCDKKSIVLPDKFLPQKEYLEYHNDIVFKP